ncbi:unnamed protein product [Ostreobium quekettii]|uniref:Uncharacterized protein n=1 Tax=Ostreobium quekettii TaxID=121088 RepID=A0A8S1IX77_9CHLO|nr:unnamed protein product [Ostreobium quekettii]
MFCRTAESTAARTEKECTEVTELWCWVSEDKLHVLRNSILDGWSSHTWAVECEGDASFPDGLSLRILWTRFGAALLLCLLAKLCNRSEPRPTGHCAEATEAVMLYLANWR